MHLYHKTVSQIKNLLDAHGVVYKTFEHEPVRTSEEASNIRPDYSIEQGAKALIVKITPKGGGAAKEKYLVQIVVPGNLRFNPKKLKVLLGAKEVRFATEEEVGEITSGVLPGGVPPFGGLFSLPVIADERLFNNKNIIFNAGDRRYSIAMDAEDYRRVVDPKVADIAEVSE